MTMPADRVFPPGPERPQNPPEPPFDAEHDRLFDALDTLRHEAFALQNRLFKAPRPQAVRLKQLLDENRAAQTELRDALAASGAAFE